MSYLMVTTTVSDRQQAEVLADGLVAERLAACVQILGPISSVYRWKGAVEKESELLLLIKTRSDLMAALEKHLAEHHPYEVPELVAMPLVTMGGDYQKWMDECLPEERPAG